MDLYNQDDKNCLASAGEDDKVSDNSQSLSDISSEPLDKYITDLRSDLRDELKGISSIYWG